MGLIEGSHDKGKENGAKGNVDHIRYVLDEDYKEGVDYAQGRTDGSQMAKDEDESPIVQIAVDALFQREALDKMGKSEAYERGYDWGKDTYGKKEHEVDVLRRTSGGRASSDGPPGSYGGGYGGSAGYEHGGASPWLRIIGVLSLLFVISCGIILFLSIVWDSPSSTSSSESDLSSTSPSGPEFDYEGFYAGHTGVPVGNVKAVPFYERFVSSPALIPSESTPFSLTPQSDCWGDSYFTDYDNGWYVNNKTLYSSPDGGETWYILLTVENLPKSYYREIMRFHDLEREDGRYLIINLMGDQQAEIRSIDGGRLWRHISYEYGNGYVMRQTYNHGKTWVEG